jgi:hypothetical protein
MSRQFGVSQTFQVLVAGVPGSTRRVFNNQIISDNTGNHRLGHLVGNPAVSTGTITVDDASFPLTETVATAAVTVLPPLTAGVVLTIGGVPLTGVAGVRTPGADDFNVAAGSGSAEDIAAEIEAALTDGANSFAALVTVCVKGDMVVLETVATGTTANATTLATSDDAQLAISSSTFSGGGQVGGRSVIELGPYLLVTGLNWNPVVGNTTTSATALAAAIDNLPGFSATSLGAVVSLEGPTGPNGGSLLFDVFHEGGVNHFVLAPLDGTLATGGPSIGPPIIG